MIDIDHRGLAAAVRADQAENLAAFDAQVDAGQRDKPAEAALHLAAFQNRRGSADVTVVFTQTRAPHLLDRDWFMAKALRLSACRQSRCPQTLT